MEEVSFIQVILPLKLDWEPYYRLPEGLSVQTGDRVRLVFARKEYLAVVSAVGVTPQVNPGKILPILSLEKDYPAISALEIQFWRSMAQYYLCTVGEVYKAAYPSQKLDQEAVKQRAAQLRERRLEKLREKLSKARLERTRERYQAQIDALERGEEPIFRNDFRAVRLSPLQEQAAARIRNAFSDQKTVLLDGITGSGKTEIYLQLSQEILSQGKNVLFLVPEIALSRQLEERVSAVFPEVLVYHSAQTQAQRGTVAQHIRSSAPYLVMGTRSALFLPHRNLGLIIVDEEHERSYKQDSPAPRYHARESAIMLSVIQGAHVLLGSATPSLESLYNASNGRFVKVDLKHRFHDGEASRLLVIDTLAERKKNGMKGSFSLKLLSQLDRTLKEGGQAVLLRSRRAYAPAVQCAECGHIPKCPHCNVSLSLHIQPDRMVCHYCGHTEPYTGVCASCGGSLQPIGAGTQKIEQELQAIFPEARIARLDSDSGPDASIIRQFAKGEIDILVGTQILTKGFDFAHLSLVAVIQADNILGQQDFRADEYAFQLLEQFRGRSGRRGSPGLFVIQTREPHHPVFSRLREGADNTQQMLEERRIFGYPPFTRLIHITLKDVSEKRLAYLSGALSASLNVPHIGPYTPVVDKVNDRFIRQIRIMLPRDKTLLHNKQQLLQEINEFEKKYKYPGHIVLDVDPV